ncbi:MAG: DUF1573 domain-containing protein [Flavobacteriales bacterium]
MKKRILSLLLGALAIGARAQSNGPSSPKGPVITFQSQEHDYGTIPFGANGDCEFTYTNTGNDFLIITSCKSSCGCVVPRYDKNPLAPGKSAVMQVRYDTRRPGPFTKSVTVESNATNTPIVVLRIKGQVLPAPAEVVPTNRGIPLER